MSVSPSGQAEGRLFSGNALTWLLASRAYRRLIGLTFRPLLWERLLFGLARASIREWTASNIARAGRPRGALRSGAAADGRRRASGRRRVRRSGQLRWPVFVFPSGSPVPAACARCCHLTGSGAAPGRLPCRVRSTLPSMIGKPSLPRADDQLPSNSSIATVLLKRRPRCPRHTQIGIGRSLADDHVWKSRLPFCLDLLALRLSFSRSHEMYIPPAT